MLTLLFCLSIWSSAGATSPLHRAVDLVLSRTITPEEKGAHPLLYLGLVNGIAADLEERDEAVRLGVLDVLFNARAVPWDLANQSDGAYLIFNELGLHLVFDERLEDGPARMLLLAHEAVHLVRDFEYANVAGPRLRISPRPLGRLTTYLVERRTAGREYDLLSRAFRLSDVGQLQGFVAESAYDALTLSRNAYVADRLGSYRAWHAHVQARRYLASLPDAMGGGGCEDLLARITRVNLEIHRARYPQKY